MELKSLYKKGKFSKCKKGMGLNDMYPAVLIIVLVGIVLGIGMYVLSQVTTEITDSDAQTAINETIDGLGGFSGWIAVIVVVIAAAIVLGIVLRSFGTSGRGI